MTRRFQPITHLLLIVLAAGLISAATQASAQTGVRVQIPFAFSAGEQQFPAGEYRIEIQPGNTHVLTLKDAETGKLKAILLVQNTYPDERMNHSSLLFHVNDGRYILTHFRIAELGRDSQLAAKIKPERVLTKNAHEADRTVELAMK